MDIKDSEYERNPDAFIVPNSAPCRSLLLKKDGSLIPVATLIRRKVKGISCETHQPGGSVIFYEEICDLINEIISYMQYNVNTHLKDSFGYTFGWLHIYDYYYFLGHDQKDRVFLQKPLKNTFNDTNSVSQLIEALKSTEREYTMTVFSFILFAITKSLYRASKSSIDKDIQLLVTDNTAAFSEQGEESFVSNVINFFVNYTIYSDYYSGKNKSRFYDNVSINDSCEEDNTYENSEIKKLDSISNDNHDLGDIDLDLDNITPWENRLNRKENEDDTLEYCPDDDIDLDNITLWENRLNRKEGEDDTLKHYPDDNIVNNNDNTVETASDSNDPIPVLPFPLKCVDYPIIFCNTKNLKKPPKIKAYFSENPYIFFNYYGVDLPRSISVTVPSDIRTCYSALGQSHYITYLENKLTDLANEKSQKTTDKIKNKLKEFFDKAHEDNPFTAAKVTDGSSISKISNDIFRICFPRRYHVPYFDNLYKEAVKELSGNGNGNDLIKRYAYLLSSLKAFKEYITDCCNDDTANKFDELYNEAYTIFLSRCNPNKKRWHTLTADKKLIVYFGDFVSALTDKGAECIITPSKSRPNMLFLDYYSYFNNFLDFMEKYSFSYRFSKQELNRILYEANILKARYNGNEKTPYKLDYILQVRGEKKTVLAINIDILERKCSELRGSTEQDKDA